MKCLFISVLLACSLATPIMQDSEPIFGDLIKGFLVGLNEKGDFSKLKDCIKDSNEILAKIKEACEGISTMDQKEVTNGVKALIVALQGILTMLKPCIQGFTQLARLATEIAKADINRLVRKVMASPGSYFHLSIDVLEALTDKKYEVAGKALGTMTKNLFLTSRTTASQMTDFLKGYLEAINENGDIKNLVGCIKESKDIFDKFIASCDKIRTLEQKDLEEGAKLFVAANNDLLLMLKACLSKFEQLKKLLVALSKANIPEIIRRIMSQAGSFFHLAINAMEAFIENNFEGAGKAIGTMVHMLFFTMEVDGPFFDFLQGFLEGLNEHGDIHKLLECLKGAEGIFDKIFEALKKILKLDFQSIFEGILMLIAAIKELVKIIEPCSEGFEQLGKLIKAAFNANIIKIVMKIIHHPEPYVHDILDMYEMLTKGQYKKAGFDLGDLLSIIFLVE